MPIVSNYAIAAILCLQTVCHCVISTVGQYIYAVYLQTYPSSSNSTQNLTTLNPIPLFHLLTTVNTLSKQCVNTSTTNAQLWAQEQSADLFFRIDLWNSCPLVLMTYILGLYTPKLGRQFVLILPMVGTSIQLAIWLAIIYFHLADYWWYIASFLVGLSGSNYILNFVLSLIITDNTKENDRSYRFVLFEAMTTGVSAGMTFGIGYYINWRGFTDLYWISLGLQSLSIMIVIFFFKNITTNLINERTALLSNSNQIKECQSLWKIFGFKNRLYKKSISLLLILFAYIFYLLAYSTYASFLWYLLDSPFCWSSENVGNYTALASILCAVFSVLGMKFLTRFGANDVMICMLSHLCFAASSFWIAFAKYNWQLYAGLVISPYADYQNSLTLPMITKWLEVHERNHAFTFVAEINTIITNFGDSIFNWVYGKTVVNFRNFTLIISAGFSIISFILNICLLVVTRRMSEENSTVVAETEPDDLTHSVDVVLIPSSLPQTPIKDRSRSNSQSSTDKQMISTDNVIVL